MARILAALVLTAAALIVGTSLLPTGQNAGTEPSYSAFEPLLDRGAGRVDDDGVLEGFQFKGPLPTGWIWTDPLPPQGAPERWRVVHTTWVEEGKTDTSWVGREDPTPQTLSDLLDWIIEKYDHVGGLQDLIIQPLDD